MSSVKNRSCFLCVLLSLALVASCGGGKTAKTAPVETRPFPRTEIPGIFDGGEEGLSWFSLHYWDKFASTYDASMSDSTRVSGVTCEDIEKAVGEWATYLTYIPTEEGSACANAMYEKISLAQGMDAASLRLLSSYVEKYLYDPNSPVRNEDIYGTFAGRLAQNALLDELERGKYSFVAKLCSFNRIGTRAADFSYTLIDGSRGRLHDIRAELTVLIFGNPDCRACAELQEYISSSPDISLKLSRKQIAIVDIFIDDDIESWRGGYDKYPSDWINGYDHLGVIRSDSIYHVRALPSIYLLDKDKKVIMKDSTPENLILYIENLL